MAAGDTKIEVVDEATEAAEAQEFVKGLGVGTSKLASRGSSLKPKVADTAPRKIAGPSSAEDIEEFDDEEEGDAPDSGAVEDRESEESAAEPVAQPAAKAQKAGASAAISDEKLLPDDVALKLVDQILGTTETKPDLASASFRVHESRRRAQAAEERAQKAEETLQALMHAVKGGKAPEAVPEPEEEIDWFADPKAATKKELQPHEQQIATLRQEIDNLKLEVIREKTYQAEAKFAEKNPGYFETIKSYRENFFQELVQRFRGNEEKALELMQRADYGVVALAQQFEEPPWVTFYDHAKRYLAGKGIQTPNGAQAPAQAASRTKTVRRDSSIASAQAANASPSATTLSAGGRENDNEDVTAATLIEQGPDAARRWIAQHGVRNIDMLIKPLEAAERARQGR